MAHSAHIEPGYIRIPRFYKSCSNSEESAVSGTRVESSSAGANKAVTMLVKTNRYDVAKSGNVYFARFAISEKIIKEVKVSAAHSPTQRSSLGLFAPVTTHRPPNIDVIFIRLDTVAASNTGGLSPAALGIILAAAIVVGVASVVVIIVVIRRRKYRTIS
jgi:hypothetical protein